MILKLHQKNKVFNFIKINESEIKFEMYHKNVINYKSKPYHY